MFVVAIIEHETKKTVKTFAPVKAIREAKQLERGVTINLDWLRFHTEIWPVTSARSRKVSMP